VRFDKPNKEVSSVKEILSKSSTRIKKVLVNIWKILVSVINLIIRFHPFELIYVRDRGSGASIFDKQWYMADLGSCSFYGCCGIIFVVE
jgi:hypothetical protein